MYDLIVKNGEIIDGGRDNEKYRADVAISKDKIVKIGELNEEEAKTVIDATGLIVAPGFIDVACRSDIYLTLFTDPGQESLISQGVTTVIGGNCGYSLAPLSSPQTLQSQQRWTERRDHINVNWATTGEFLDHMSVNELPVNFGTLTGHDTLRRAAPKSEMALSLLKQSMKDGSFGLSMSHSFPEKSAREIEYLSDAFRAVKSQNRVIAVHLDDEMSRMLDSLNSILSLTKETGASIHISHLKVIHRKYWGNFQRALAMIEKYAHEGLSVSFDVFPYASSALALCLILPAWARSGETGLVIKRLRNKFERQQIARDLKSQGLEYDKMTVASLAPIGFIGKTVAEIARDTGLDAEETICEILLASNLEAIVFAHILDESAVKTGIANPHSVIGSSGAGYRLPRQTKQTGDLISYSFPHPRSFGAFPRLLKKYALEENVISLKEAVAKITGRPAKIFGIRNRGLVKENYFADLAIFNPDSISDAATFQNPFRYSTGMDSVIINGQITLRGGGFVKNRAGKIIHQ